MGCHGVPGRVPSMQLHPPDRYGYTTVADLLYNYRTLQQRVVLTDLEKSKLLRKPLNIQDGKEDGHQGGRRYNPTDEGYLVLKHWAENQPAVQKPANETAPHASRETSRAVERSSSASGLHPGVCSKWYATGPEVQADWI